MVENVEMQMILIYRDQIHFVQYSGLKKMEVFFSLPNNLSMNSQSPAIQTALRCVKLTLVLLLL